MDDIMMSLLDQMLCGHIGAVEIVKPDFIDFTVVQIAFDQDTVYGLGGDTAEKLLICTVAAVLPSL